MNNELIKRANHWHNDVKNHYNNLLNSIDNKTYKDLKILVFQPVSNGDILVSSHCLELFQLKYPGCKVDYLIEGVLPLPQEILANNPFINKALTTLDWNIVKKRDTCELGDFAKKYDKVYSLYWWDENIIKSFLSDLELPNDYTKLWLYTNKETNQFANKVWKDSKKLKICLMSDIHFKWTGSKDLLKQYLEDFGTVVEIGPPDLKPNQSLSILAQADIYIGAHGALEHMAGGLDVQCICMSPHIPSKHCAASSYQNQYRKDNEKHISIEPNEVKDCKWACLTYNKNEFIHKNPPYGFPDHFPPHVNKDCVMRYTKHCRNYISIDDIINKVEEVIKLRNK